MPPAEGGAATGLSPEQLGPCSWVIQGQAASVDPDTNTIVVATPKGNQPLDVTAESRVLDQNANEISLSDIKPGEPVVASFSRQNGKNVVGRLYRLPEQGGAGGACPPSGGAGGGAYPSY
ncbi:MAG: hypothetical protein V2A77_10435 [Pseudomonadota bacterium]